MPKAAEFMERARKMVASLKELREAPLADEDYHGPVLLSADSAATVFASLVGANVLGTKPDLGQNARVRGQFASSYKTRVLPEFLTVSDDPSLTTDGGKTLLGHYDVDDEGVKAVRVPVIEKGVLVNYLLGREPIRDFAVSNGHSRSGGLSWPVPGLGNLVVRSEMPVPAAELKQKLIAMCKERGLDFGYYAETLGGYRAPRLLYRVWVKDGHEELVRGGLFGDLDQRTMRSNIIAAGDDRYVENHVQPYLYSVTAPSILFDDLEVKRQTTNKEKLPVYPSPEEAQK
jgi:predicted Zn-dependent protease